MRFRLDRLAAWLGCTTGDMLRRLTSAKLAELLAYQALAADDDGEEWRR